MFYTAWGTIEQNEIVESFDDINNTSVYIEPNPTIYSVNEQPIELNPVIRPYRISEPAIVHIEPLPCNFNFEYIMDEYNSIKNNKENITTINERNAKIDSIIKCFPTQSRTNKINIVGFNQMITEIKSMSKINIDSILPSNFDIKILFILSNNYNIIYNTYINEIENINSSSDIKKIEAKNKIIEYGWRILNILSSIIYIINNEPQSKLRDDFLLKYKNVIIDLNNSIINFKL